MVVWGFFIIDEMYTAPDILAHVSAMTPLQRHVHMWMTATLDALYPFTYGAFLIGMANKAFPAKAAFWLSLPAVFCISVDLIEGYAQVMLLIGGHDEYVELKTVVTPLPLKLILFCTSLVVSLVGASRLHFSHQRKERRE